MNSKTQALPAAGSTEASHDNGFGLLRLVFAALVIVSHTPEMHDGNRDRELLWMLTRSMSFGELAVDGFFVISGFLITASFVNSRSTPDYLLKRVARIYPGFLMASAACIFVAAPLGGVEWALGSAAIGSGFVRALLLQPPNVGPVFIGTPGATLNGSMWTIIYEFQCYLLIALLGVLGLLRYRGAMLALFVLAATIAVLQYHPYHSYYPATVPTGASNDRHQFLDVFTRFGVKVIIFSTLIPMSRLVAVFVAGSCYYLFTDILKFTGAGAVLALIACGVSLFSPSLHDIGFAVFGGYVILYLAEVARGTIFARLNNRDDVSYGVYLYAWPVSKLLFWYAPGLSLIVVGLATFIISYALGWASWRLVERPAMGSMRAALRRFSSARDRAPANRPARSR